MADGVIVTTNGTFAWLHIALSKFRAAYGQGDGLPGQSYATPTRQGGIDTVAPYVDESFMPIFAIVKSYCG